METLLVEHVIISRTRVYLIASIAMQPGDVFVSRANAKNTICFFACVLVLGFPSLAQAREPFAFNQMNKSLEILSEGTLALNGQHVTPFYGAVEALTQGWHQFAFSCAVFVFDLRDNEKYGGAIVSKMSNPKFPALALTIEPALRSVEDEGDSGDSDEYEARYGSVVSYAVTFSKTYTKSNDDVVASFTVSGTSRRRISAGKWHHVAIVVDLEKSVSFFMDGVLDVESALPPNRGKYARNGLFISRRGAMSALDDALSIGGESRERRTMRMQTIKTRFEPPNGLKALVHAPRLRVLYDDDLDDLNDDDAVCDDYDYDENLEEEEEEEGEEENVCTKKISKKKTSKQNKEQLDDPNAWYYEAMWSKYDARKVGSGGAENEDADSLLKSMSTEVETSGFEKEAMLESRNLEILELMAFDPEPPISITTESEGESTKESVESTGSEDGETTSELTTTPTNDDDDETNGVAAIITSKNIDREKYFDSFNTKNKYAEATRKLADQKLSLALSKNQRLLVNENRRISKNTLLQEALDLYRLAAAAGNEKARRAAASLLSHEYVYRAGGGYIYGRTIAKDEHNKKHLEVTSRAESSSRAAYHRMRGAYLGDQAMRLSVAVDAMRRKTWGPKSCLIASQYLFLSATKAYEEYNKPSGQVRIEKQRLHDRLKVDESNKDAVIAAVDSDIGVPQNAGVGVDRPDERAQWLMNQAQGGDANAMVHLANAHYWGHRGLQRNQEAAANMYRRAHEAGAVQGTVGLAKLMLKGEGVKKNLTKAMELYEDAASKGIADAYNGLGFAAFYGSEGEFEANKTLALINFRKAAALGSPDGMVNAGLMLRGGMGVEGNKVDTKLAYTYFRRCADQFPDHISCQYNAGSLELSEVTNFDIGVDKDNQCMLAARRLRRVAETAPFNQIAESALKSFTVGNLSEARFKYDVASDYGVSSSAHNAAWLYEKAQKKYKFLGESKIPIVGKFFRRASRYQKMRAIGGFVGSSRERLRREFVAHVRKLSNDLSATTNERTWAYLKLGEALYDLSNEHRDIAESSYASAIKLAKISAAMNLDSKPKKKQAGPHKKRSLWKKLNSFLTQEQEGEENEQRQQRESNGDEAEMYESKEREWSSKEREQKELERGRPDLGSDDEDKLDQDALHSGALVANAIYNRAWILLEESFSSGDGKKVDESLTVVNDMLFEAVELGGWRGWITITPPILAVKTAKLIRAANKLVTSTK